MAKKTQNGYLNNPRLKQVGEAIDFTQEQIDEYAKCSVDPVYFLENYGKIISLDHGIIPFKLHGYQKELITSFHERPKTLAKLFRQQGKCYLGDTKYTIRNKMTGETLEVTAEEFHQRISNVKERGVV